MDNKTIRSLWYTVDSDGNLKISVGKILMETVEDCKNKSADEINSIIQDVIDRKEESFKLTEKLFG